MVSNRCGLKSAQNYSKLTMQKYPKVCIIGAEGWGSAISTAVSKNVVNNQFNSRVHIYVFDELVRSNYLSEVMNERHENIKYLPGIKLPSNLIAVNDLLEAAQNADILIFATPHTFVKAYCNILEGNVKKSAYVVSLIKGLEHVRDGEIDLYSHKISNQLGIPCYSAMNANSAMEMAQGKLCEITIGCNDEAHSKQLISLLQTENCMVFTIDDVEGVEMCGTLKDLVAMSAGIIDGLHLGENARIACLHLGMKEMMRFIKHFNPSTKMMTFLESCGLAHSVASSYADKHATFAKSFVSSRKTIQEIEANLLNGRKLLGPILAEEIYAYLEKEGLHKEFPLFSIMHRICQREVLPNSIVDVLRNHPDLRNYSVTHLQKNEYVLAASSTESIFDNLPDTVPEYSPAELPGISFEKGLENVAKKDDFWKGYVNFFNENRNTTEIEESPVRRRHATGAINKPNTDNGSVEFLFEMESPKDLREVSYSLNDTFINKEIEAGEETQKNNISPIDRQVSSNKRHSPPTTISAVQGYNDKLSNNKQKEQISQSVNDKSIAEDSPTKVGLTDLGNQSTISRNNKYRGLKVSVNDKSETPKKSEAENQPTKAGSRIKMESMTKANSIDFKKTAPPNNGYKDPELQNKNPTNEETEHLLYDINPIFGIHLFEDEPHPSSFLEKLPTKQKKVLEKPKDKTHPKMKDMEQATNEFYENKNDSSKGFLESNANKGKESVDRSLSDNKWNPEGYKYDYKISIQSKKVPIDKPIDKDMSTKVSFPYSKKGNSSAPTKAKLKAQDYWQKYNFKDENNQDEDGQRVMTKGKLETDNYLAKTPNGVRFNPLDVTPGEPLFVIGSVKENQPNCRLDNNPQNVPYPKTLYRNHSKDISMVPKGKDINRKSKSEVESEDAILDDKMPSPIKIVHKNEREEINDKICDVDSNKNSARSSFDESFDTSEPCSKLEELDSIQKLKARVEGAISNDKVNAHQTNDKTMSKIRPAWLSFDDNLRSSTSAKNNEGVKYIQEMEAEVAETSDKNLKSGRSNKMNISNEEEEDQHLSVKFERANRDEDCLLSAESESRLNKAAKKLYSEWERLLADYKFDDALKEFRREELRENDFGKSAKAEAQQFNAEPGLTDQKEKQLDVMQLTMIDEDEPARKPNSAKKELKTPEELPSNVSNAPKKELAQENVLYKSEVRQAQKTLKDEQKTDVQDQEETRKITNKLSEIMTKGRKDKLKTRERPIDYQGPNPYMKDEKILPKQAYCNAHERVNKKQRRVVVKPFHPPLNPHVRVPRPPFDVRDHEYHTVNFRPPPDLLRNASLPQKPLAASCHATQASTRSVAKLPRPALKMPPSMMRPSVLSIELGIFAALLSRYRGSCK